MADKDKTKKNRKKFIIPAAAVLIILLIAGWGVFTVNIYNENFDIRFESYEPRMYYVEDFDGLSRTRYEFPSDKGQKLAGYLYSAGEEQHGIIVLAHGFGGGGHNSYMDIINCFAHNGYYVFAYDATGNDESEGKGVGGVPQGVIDLEYAITFVEESGNFPDLPIGLFGHSWGGYSVCNVLNYHPEVKAVIECSGCNSSADMFEAGGRSEAGPLIYTMTPFVKIYERIKYGEYAINDAIDGFTKSDAHVMVVHSKDDGVIPPKYGYDIYFSRYKDDPRFVFLLFDDKGHNDIYCDKTYRDEFNAEFDRWLPTLDYDYKAEENTDRFIKDKADYIHEHLDREKWCNRLNMTMMDDFLSFYNENLT